MWLLDRCRRLRDCGVFEGFIDYHSHLLPGVDDGVATLEESLEILDTFESLGVRTVCITPHVMEDYPNTTSSLQERFAELRGCYRGSVNLRLSAEYMLDNLFEERLSAGDLLSLGTTTDHLLVETSYFNPPLDLVGTLAQVKRKGYHPVLAHPERYNYMTDCDYRELKEMQVKFQLNLPSLTGAYGPEVRDKAYRLLSAGMIDLLGSDTHSLKRFQGMIVRKSVKRKPDLRELAKGLKR